MKRTFGRFMSLLLVLAMVLAMVPAVLAADSDPIEDLTAVPGEVVALTIPKATATQKYYWKAASSNTQVTVPYSTTGGTNSVTVSDSITKTTTGLLVYAYATATAADKNLGFSSRADKADRAIYGFRIAVTPWTVSLAVSPSSGSFNDTLEQNGTVELRAAVTGLASRIANQKVKFTISTANVASFVTTGSTAPTTIESDIELQSQTSGYAYATVKGGPATGKFYVTASVVPTGGKGATVSARYPSKTTSYIEVRSGASYSLTLAEENIYVTKGGTNKAIKPTLKLGTKTVTGSYTYTFPDNTNTTTVTTDNPSGVYIVVADDGTIYPQVEETPAPVKVKVTESTSGLTKDCYVNIVKNTATITDLTVSDASGLSTKKFAKIPTDSLAPTVMTDLLTNTVRLEATIVSESDSAANRLVWTTSSSSIATVQADATDNSKATVTAVGTGKVTIKATMPSTSGSGTSRSVELYVWETKAYKAIELPTVSGSVNDPNETCTELGKKTLKATLAKGTNQTVNLSATYAYDYANGKYTIKGAVDGVDATNKIFYYPTSACTKLSTAKDSETGKYFTFTAGEVTISTVQIDGPKDASFKVNEKLGSLTCTIRTTENNEYITQVVWKDKNNTIVQTDNSTTIGTNRRYYVSTLNLASKITSPGDYQYYCEITTKKGETETVTRSGIANVVVGGDYIISIGGLPTSVKVGDTITFTAKPQQYINGKYTDVTASNYTVAWSVSDASVGTLNRTTGSSVSFSVKGGGKVTVSAETTIGSNKYTGTKEFTVTVPTADTVRLSLEENATYVLLDGSKLASAVKDACKSTPSTFTFKSPTNGTLYTTSAMSSSISTSTKYTASDISKMAYRPTRTTGTHEIEYAAYDGTAQIAEGKILVMTSANTVSYHISANEKQQMVVSDFQAVYGTGLSSVTFGTNSNTHGVLYKGNTTSSGKVGTEAYSVSGSTNLLKNVCFIADSTTSKYSVTIPFTATGSSGTVSGQLVVYVNDTHTLNITGATFRSMSIAAELAPANATGSTYITIDRVVGGRLYSSYTSIKSCTALTSKDLGSTKFYFTGSNSVDNLYVLPLADSKSVEVSYTIDGSTKGTLTFKVNERTASAQFTDVVANFKWAANSVDFMYMNGIINGNSTSNPRIFGPGAKMTRAMLVTVLYRAAGEPTVAGITNKFTDNKEGKYYYNAVLWASSLGIVNGATATTFDPDGNITREQIAAILYRYAGSPTVTGSLSGYADQTQVSPFAVTAMQWAVGTGIITGTPNGGKTYLTAKGNATRAQVAVMLHRFLTFD